MWDQWRNWADSCAVSFFQSAEWGEVLAKHYPFFHPEPISAEFFFFPLLRHHRWGWMTDSLYGMPMMSTGGILSAPENVERAWLEVERSLKKKSVGTLVISLPVGSRLPPTQTGLERSEQTTHIVDLSQGWEKTYSRFKKSCKEAIRRAERLGVQIHRMETEEGARIHWSLIQEEFQKWRPNPPLSYDFIDDLIRLDQSRLYVASVENRPVLSLLAFVYGGEVFLWQSAKVREGFPPGSSNLLTSRIFREATKEGCRIANFGGSVGNVRIERYKESYGAVKTPFTLLKRIHPLVRVIKRLRAQ